LNEKGYLVFLATNEDDAIDIIKKYLLKSDKL